MRKTLALLIFSIIMVIAGVGCSFNNYNNDTAYTGKKIGFVKGIDPSKMQLVFDEIEWITQEDSDRIEELRLEEFDMPNGYYINNDDDITQTLSLSNDIEYTLVNWGGEWGNQSHYTTKDINEILYYLDTYTDRFDPLFWINIDEGLVVNITEQFIP